MTVTGTGRCISVDTGSESFFIDLPTNAQPSLDFTDLNDVKGCLTAQTAPTIGEKGAITANPSSKLIAFNLGSTDNPFDMKFSYTFSYFI